MDCDYEALVPITQPETVCDNLKRLLSGGMKRPNAFLLLLCALSLCGCVLDPGKSTGGMDTEEWCSKDVKRPWTGCWIEVARLDCESGQEFEPQEIIGEFRLTPDGRYSVTWTPFETFVDYAGQYQVSEEDGTMELTVGDRAPAGAKGQGRFSITDQGDLLLEGIWLGARYQRKEVEACGHRFRPR
ncbi:MAG: hypothetical protein P8129_23610 [Anaerolineae bacterium]